MWNFLLIQPKIMEAEQPTWEILKLIIQAQYQITALGIGVLVAIAIIIIGGNWIGTQRKVKKITRELHAKMNSITEDHKKTKDEMRIKLLLLKGETERIFSTLYRHNENWLRAAIWAAGSVEHFSKAGKTRNVKNAVNILIRALKNCKFMNTHSKRKMMERINYIPDEFKDKREEIRDLINKLHVKETKEEI